MTHLTIYQGHDSSNFFPGTWLILLFPRDMTHLTIYQGHDSSNYLPGTWLI